MVTDIFARAERFSEGVWTIVPNVRPFSGWSSYRLFGFLADVRNYAAITPVSKPRGLPAGVTAPPFDDDDVEGDEWLGEHDYSWLLVSELLSVEYEQMVEDRRTSGMINGIRDGSLTAQPGHGVRMTLREFLGEAYFDELARLEEAGVERIVFGFGS